MFFFKQKAAYEMLISDWSSDVCSSDLQGPRGILQLYSPPTKKPPLLFYLSLTDSLPVTGSVVDAVHVVVDRSLVTGQNDASPGLAVPIGRASCRERVCTYVSISVVAVSLKKE